MIRPDVDITIGPNYVGLFNQMVFRREGQSVSQWLEFWEKVKRLDEHAQRTEYEAEIDELKGEVENLNGQLNRLNMMRDNVKDVAEKLNAALDI